MLYFAKEVNPVFVGAIIGLFSLVALVGRYWNSVKQHRGVKIMDAPGSSLAPCFYPQKASCNHLRLCLLFTLLCDDLFRDILSRYIKPTYLRPKLDINKQKLVKHFNKQQQNLIYPTTGNTSLTAKDFDISTIYILLRNICNIPSHKAGWGNLPVKGDNSIAAGIEIIRLTRNSIVHSTNGMIEDLVFEKHWKELRDAVVQIETQLTGSDLYKRGVDFLYSCNLIAVGTEAYQNEEKCKQDSVERAARFAEFFDELAEGVPVEKIARLKDFIQNNCKAEDIATIKQAVSARDCLRYLRDEKRFTSSDVMFVQYLFKRIDCKELFVKCYKYAEKQEALCFYEKPPANGYKNVLFHVKGNLSDYSRERIAEIRETLAVLLNCNSKEILIGGACPSASFLLVLSIKDAYSYKLLALEQCDKDKLTKLDIDYIIVDLTVINLEPSKEYGWNIYFDPKHFNRKEYENLLSQEEKSTVSPLQYITTVFQETESSSDEVSKDSSSTSDMIFVAGPVVVSPADNIRFATVFKPLSNPIISNTRWFKIRNSLNTKIIHDNIKHLITNSSTVKKIQKMEITDAGVEDSGGYQLSYANTKSNIINTFVDGSGRYSTEKENNCLRFFALLTVGADAVRTAFDGISPSFENKLNKFIQQCSSNTKYREAISSLKKNPPSSSKHLDMTVMYTIIRNVTNLAKPQNGWGNSPSDQDLGTAADIERFREYRNIIAHKNNLDMETPDFNESALDLIWVIRRLSNDEVQLLEQIPDVMNKIFIKGEQMAEMVEKLRKFQKETKELEQLFGYEVSEVNFEAQTPYARLSFFNEDLKFHHVHDSCIEIKNEGKSASKAFLQESKKGVCFLTRCMKIGEKIHLNGHHRCFDNVHHICFGLTNTYPGSFSGNENIASRIDTKLQPVRVCSNTHRHHIFFLEHLFGEGSCFESFNVCIMLCSDATLSIRRNDTEQDWYTPDSNINRSLPLWLVIELNGDQSLNISNRRA